jgi:hypothetical protein
MAHFSAVAERLKMNAPLRLLTISLLVLCASPAWAEWERVTEMPESSLYISPGSITKKGNYRRFWQLSDYKKPDENGDRSARVLTEFDCKKQRVRSLKWAYFRGAMGSREMTAWRTKPEKWMPVAPGTLGQTIGKLVCET